MNLWEILVPVANNEGKDFSAKHHKEWDAFVFKTAGGMSIQRPLKGHWVNDKAAKREPMIPVRICCEREQIERIVSFTIAHYDQIEVMAYHLSDQVIRARR